MSYDENYYNWSPEKILEIELADPDAFLKIKETLTRIGIASKAEKTLWASCAILHRRGKYYIMHFKELFSLDGRPADITYEDIKRRNTIARLLQEWGLCKIVTTDDLPITNMSNIKVISYNDKKNWKLLSKYTMRSDRNK